MAFSFLKNFISFKRLDYVDLKCNLKFIICLEELIKEYKSFIQKLKNGEYYNKNEEQKFIHSYQTLCIKFGVNITYNKNYFSYKDIYNFDIKNTKDYNFYYEIYNYIFSKDVSEEEHLDRLNYLKVIVEDELFINIKDINFLENMDFNTFLKFYGNIELRLLFEFNFFNEEKLLVTKMINFLNNSNNLENFYVNTYKKYQGDYAPIKFFLINFSTRDHQFNSIFRLNIDSINDFNKLVSNYSIFTEYMYIYNIFEHNLRALDDKKKYDIYNNVFDEEFFFKNFKEHFFNYFYDVYGIRNTTFNIGRNLNILLEDKDDDYSVKDYFNVLA